jgi:hypothetical protein
MVLTEADSSRPISMGQSWVGSSRRTSARARPGRAIRARRPGSGARTGIADRALDYGDRKQVGTEPESHVGAWTATRSWARRRPGVASGVWWFSPIAQVRLPQQRLSGRRGDGHHRVVTAPRGAAPVTLPREPGRPAVPATPRALPRTLSTGVSTTPVLTEPIRSPHPVRGWSHDRLARTTCGSRSDSPATPALLSSGYLPAALALLMLPRSRSMVGWLAPGSSAVPGGAWPRRAASPGPWPLLIIGPSVGRWQPPGCCGRPGGGRNGPSGLVTGNRIGPTASKDHGRLGSLWRQHGGGRGCGGSSRLWLVCLP